MKFHFSSAGSKPYETLHWVPTLELRWVYDDDGATWLEQKFVDNKNPSIVLWRDVDKYHVSHVEKSPETRAH